MWAVVPNTSDKRVEFVRSFGGLNDGIMGMNEGIDKEVEGDYNKV